MIVYDTEMMIIDDTEMMMMMSLMMMMMMMHYDSAPGKLMPRLSIISIRIMGWPLQLGRGGHQAWAKPDDLRVTLGARSLQLGRGGHQWRPPRHAGDRWVPVQPTPRASGLGFVPGPSPRGLYPTGAWHAEKKRMSSLPPGLIIIIGARPA